MAASSRSFALLPDQGGIDAPEKSSGVFPARKISPYDFYQAFRDEWPAWLKSNFRNSVEVAAFFNVDERTARGWLEGVTGPRGQVVAYAVAAMPGSTSSLLRAVK